MTNKTVGLTPELRSILASNRAESLCLLQGWKRGWDKLDVNTKLTELDLDTYYEWASGEMDSREKIAAEYFDTAYQLRFGQVLDPEVFGYATLSELLRSPIFIDPNKRGWDILKIGKNEEDATVVRDLPGDQAESTERGGHATLRFSCERSPPCVSFLLLLQACPDRPVPTTDTLQCAKGAASFSTGSHSYLVQKWEEALKKNKTLKTIDLSDNQFNVLSQRKLTQAAQSTRGAGMPTCSVDFSHRTDGTGLGDMSASGGRSADSTPSSSAAATRSGLASRLGPAVLMAVGGFDGSVLQQCEVYDSVQRSWQNISSLCGPRCSAAVCSLSDSRVLVAGGTD